ncbi:hypothetical protein HQ865_07885 [Mucilaginibacter mali]|uniref:Uncharacterized protein n=1 Tax=Mucilaginibacter mali TaxID=2740462 RepID=A0A7D4TWN9_9SPHI|nr:hypothetical protein [Mucilaginibacter mali]QKJ29677.1 hypothetical protein HQ865_07885 [Mucilaginibacter mali]
MKKPFSLSSLFSIQICFSLVLFLICINSCKKDLKPTAEITYSKVTGVDKLADADKVSSADITTWITNVPGGLPYKIDWSTAKQSVINKKHVIKVPLKDNAALFFTREEGKLLVFAYKWLDAKPGAKRFTGKIASFSFQDYTIRTMFYENGSVTNAYQQSVSTSSTKSALSTQSEKLKNNNILADIGEAISKAWCFITGGSWGYTDSGYGYVGGCVYDDYEGLDEVSNGAWTDYWTFSGSGIPGVVIGGITGGGGGGAPWVSVYVPDAQDPDCPPDLNPASNHLVINHVPPPDGCPTPSGHWEPVQVVLPEEAVASIITRDTSITNIPRLDSIFKKLINNNQVFDSLSRAYKNSLNYNLRYKVSDTLATNELGHTRFDGGSTSTNAPLNGTATVSLNRNFIRTDINTAYINIVRTILHETWHAELDYLLKTIYNQQNITIIQQRYNITNIHDLTIHQLIDLLAVDQNNQVNLGGTLITANTNWSQLEQHNYMVKNIDVLAKGINLFLISTQSPLANNREFIYAEALSTLMAYSTYFQVSANQNSFLQYFPGYTQGGAITLTQYINSVYSNNIANLGPLR